MRIVLVGAVESTKVAFDTLVEAGSPPSAIVTLPSDGLARHSDAVDLSVHAKELGIPAFHSLDINSAGTLAELQAHAPDLILVIGWSQICKSAFRSSARLGCIGFHPSALPSLRGRAVIPWTILTRQTTAGSTFFWLDDGIDTGDIVLQRRFPLGSEETARTLYDKQMDSIRDLLPQVVRQFAGGHPNRIVQDEEGASYCARRGPEDGKIDWRDDATDILALIRAVGDPYPGAFTTYEGEHLWVDRARFFDGGERFIGTTGQIQMRTEAGFVVRCGDGACIEILAWRWPLGKLPPRHSVLGRNG